MKNNNRKLILSTLTLSYKTDDELFDIAFNEGNKYSRETASYASTLYHQREKEKEDRRLQLNFVRYNKVYNSIFMKWFRKRFRKPIQNEGETVPSDDYFWTWVGRWEDGFDKFFQEMDTTSKEVFLEVLSERV